MPNCMPALHQQELKEFLDEKVVRYNQPHFLESDPLGVVHQFSNPRDIEIAGFLAATIAWGQRKTIIANTNRLIEWMHYAPYAFVVEHTAADLAPFKTFVHRTFNGIDCTYFISALKHLLTVHGSLEQAFVTDVPNATAFDAIQAFRGRFFDLPHETRTEKHVSNPAKNASAKRLNMFLRWMVRSDAQGIDFGIWKTLLPSQLMCPLDVHTANVGRKLGLLSRKQNDRKAVEELTASLRAFDVNDPVKYDFALFGLGVFEGF